jgi:hypothetical protein
MTKKPSRRRASRVPRSYPVRFWTKDWQGAGTVTNVSAGGLFLSAWPPVEEGDKILFEADTDTGPYAGAGEVTHIVGVVENDADQSGMGVRLVDWADAVGVREVQERVSTPVDPDHSFGWSWRIW